ncbi:LacI family transcriptional regulator [Rhodococcus opacus PD630]|uniref:LacI family DNA-binding transcriptional regulator n=1 Tax=Rhodococcus TaxID=1827 RepID=UPI00029CC0F3|nr:MULTISPECIES: LacI family DNA-binding transcriptional regulator [Rhodococcus]KXF54296.1 LacI family transcriptional regulator [Rhodococcus sp. SC4]AHK28330.1 HTH-type transcriptional regulator degA [Rhodococcus opacus PD630]EHI44604.1 LacI family transcriptional regulator [Rhodococcus opacus PD630]KXX61200.1 LacI family transcriptional regulator [Rhodococcus sp. LB1]PBC54142.1 LacI family transcriptional regulator [Rhodococcus sp. ACPA1]
MGNPKKPRATLRLIADELGVHVSTVSRVLNGTTEPGVRAASAATTERIRALADSLGYRPNPHAASLRTNRSNLIGVLVPRLSDYVLATVYEGIEEAAEEAGLSTFVTNSLDEPDNQSARTDMLLARRVDGLIFGDAHMDHRFLDSVAERGTPFVLVSRRSGEYPSVTCDDRTGGSLAARHLLDRGHERVGIIAGLPFASTTVDRSGGFAETFAAAGCPVPEEDIVYTGFDAAGGRLGAVELLAREPGLTAIFATNDFAAIGAYGALRDAGREVGRDVAVIGYNDIPLSAEITVALTTIRSPMHAMGRRSVQKLVELLGGAEVTSERLAPELVERASTDFRL